MKIIRATVLSGKGPDKIMLHTDLPEACYPYNGFLYLDFNCAQDKGDEYLAIHFPNIPTEIIKID
jgi:hypothetical protein